MYKAIILVAMVAFLSINTNVANAETGENAKQHSICELMTGEDLLEDTQAFFEGKPLYVSCIMPEAQCPIEKLMELEAEVKNSGGQYAMELGEDEKGENFVVIWRRW